MGNEPIYVFGATKNRREHPVIAHHLVISGYGHWLSNDIRGSGSTEIREEKFKPLGEIHFGRKPQQPSRKEIKDFYRRANPLLKFEALWFKDAHRTIIANAFAQVIRDYGYTVYACAICSNHGHVVVRRHRDDATTIFWTFAGAAADALRRSGLVHEDHPIWADRPYGVYLVAPSDVHGRVDYVERNPTKEGLPRQYYDFVSAYDNWPFHKRLRSR